MVRKNDWLPREAVRVTTGSVESTGEAVYLRSTVTLRARLHEEERLRMNRKVVSLFNGHAVDTKIVVDFTFVTSRDY